MNAITIVNTHDRVTNAQGRLDQARVLLDLLEESFTSRPEYPAFLLLDEVLADVHQQLTELWIALPVESVEVQP